MFLVVFEASYALCPWSLQCLQIDIHIMHLWVVWKFGNQMGWDLDCSMFGGGEAWISVLRSSVVMMQNNSIYQHSCLFTVNSEFKLLFKYSTVPCTAYHLSMILVVLMGGSIKDPKQCQHHFASKGHTSEFLGPWQWCVFPLHALMIAGMFIVVHPCFIGCDNPSQESLCFMTLLQNCMHISVCVHVCSSVSCFGTHIAQILWYQKSSRMFEYADPQLISNLSVTVIGCIEPVLTCSALSAISEVVGWPEWSSLMMLVLPLWNLSIH